MTSFGERLRELRRRKQVKQTELAELLGLTERTIRHYELNTREPDMNGLAQLADFFGVTIDYLVGRSDGPQQGKTAPPSVLGEVPVEQSEFLKWVEENLEESFFYDFDSSPEENKASLMEALRFMWEQEKKRGKRE